MSTVATRLPAATFHRRRATAVVVAALVAAAVVAGLSSLGTAGSGPLAWSGDGEVFAHPTLPGDRVLTANLRNDGSGPLRVDIGRVRLIDADGRVVESKPVFLRMFGESSWATARDSELQRTGRIAALRRGEEVPLTIAWHAEDGDPVRVDYGRGWLSLPG